MSVLPFAGGASGGGHELLWEAEHDTDARTVVLTATHARFGGLPQLGPPQLAIIVVTMFNGQDREFDLLATESPVDGLPGLINKGPQTFSNINLKLGQGRGRTIDFNTDYIPPAAE